MADKKPADRYPDSEGPFAGPNNTFPLNTAARVRNAWSRIHQKPTMDNHSPEEIASIKSKIKARAKELGIKLDDSGERSLHNKPAIERIFTTSWSDSKLGVEVRSLDGRSSRTVGGYAAVFGARSDPRLGFREVVERSFFNKSQGDGWPGAVARYEHDPSMLLGAVHSGTLRLRTDDYGLDYEVDLPETRSDVYESIQRGDTRQSSFAFQAYDDEFRLDNGYPTRHLVSGRLIDVAPTAVPAYPDATVALRSLAMKHDASFEEIEELAADDNLRVLFTRTDNIDTRESMSENRSAPLVTINVNRDGQVEAKEAAPEPKSEDKPLEEELKSEEKPKAPEPEPKPEPEPEPEPVPAAAEEKPKSPAPEPKPEPKVEDSEEEERMSWMHAVLFSRQNRPDDPIVEIKRDKE